ncbi:AAA family ATPase [Aureimonas pseudogalii]|uniref:SpoVK/Ycf46/Vps4 family AAA+-type ATPase n=1 Tax=Aureimonas pseudogalii TaxID=1744844 RepID=A0A7W6EBM0_9HYPH|nr:AAA family ATPase [Aureimonas pseudogalii]MBB3998363.1 SpoVK/Ycf46/Vps4 family AAA+-type ATPase [Aureimonas pseudogalii]
MARLDRYQPIDIGLVEVHAERFDPSAFLATALVKRAFRAAGLQHVLSGAPCIVALAGVRESEAGLFEDAIEALFREAKPPRNRIRVEDRTGARADRTPDMTSLIRSLHASQHVCFLYDLVEAVPPHVAELVDGVAMLPWPEDDLLRAVALQVPGGRNPTAKDIEDISSVPWPLLTLLLESGRSLRSAISLAGRIEAATAAERATAREKSSVRKVVRNDGVPPGPTLDELHGLGDASNWGKALAVDLADYAAGHIAWSDVDRGALLSGAPGTGKTTFALALGRTCGVPVFVHSLARWQAAGYLNKLLEQMRGAFEEAKAKAPSILFVDELDSFGDRANASDHNANYTREVINGFPECLDGAEARTGVVVVGATNHPELIDPAIRRAGRLDRHLHIPMPDESARKHILLHHLRGELVEADLLDVPRLTEGMTGADIEQLVRVARRAARTSRRALAEGDLLGSLPPPVRMGDALFRRICVHEAGHVVVGAFLAGTSGSVPVRASVTREVRNNVSNRTDFAQVEGFDRTRPAYLAVATTMLAGMAAEEVVLGACGDTCGGAAGSDLSQAAGLIGKLELALGLGNALLTIETPSPEAIARRLEADPIARARVESVLQEALGQARAIVAERRAEVEAVAECLASTGTWTVGHRGAEPRKPQSEDGPNTRG